MLANMTKTISMAAVSAVKNETGGFNGVMTFVASIQPDGKWSVTETSENNDLYEQNIEQTDADYTEFKKEVLKQVKAYKEKDDDNAKYYSE